eukprot:m.263444 g.263444  ORF g.263444 m.263444 type:complete len:365 (+) comp50435_c0_seq1:183-1277(+)
MFQRLLQEQLTSVTLKQTSSIMRDGSRPQMKCGEMTAKETEQYQESVLDVNIEHWYDLIKEFTFETKFLPFDRQVGQLFIECYTDYEQHQKDGIRAGGNLGPYMPAQQLQTRVYELEQSLQATIEAVRLSDNVDAPVFIKASSRSAKDAPTSQHTLSDMYKARLAVASDRTDNTKVICMLQAGLEMLKAYTAADALRLFMCSERLMQDMLLALQRPDRWVENFVVRQWVDIDVDMEFRGFVKDGKLCALSQYNHLAYFPRVANQQDHIASIVRDFFKRNITSALKQTFDDYIVDFAITHLGEENQKIWVIELNPFLETTDGCLFSWKTDRDTLEGRNDFEMRVCTAPRNGVKALVGNDWRHLLE